MTEFDLLVIGDCNPDLILSGDHVVPVFGQVERLIDQARLEIGGSATLTACAAARLGLNTALVSMVGDDMFGRFMRESICARGVDDRWLTVDPNAPTGLTVILARPDGDRAILTAAGTLSLIGPASVPVAAFAQTRHVHLAGYYLTPELQPGVADIFTSAHAAGATTSLDTGWDPTGRWDDSLNDALEETDWFFPNEQEARHVTGENDIEVAAARLGSGGGGVVVKLGQAGGLLRRADDIVRSAALNVETIDTVGAGDCFAAGFLTGQLHQMTLSQSLDLACACGSLSTRCGGGILGQPTLSQAREALRTVPRR